jgi:hypothetical protein
MVGWEEDRIEKVGLRLRDGLPYLYRRPGIFLDWVEPTRWRNGLGSIVGLIGHPSRWWCEPGSRRPAPSIDEGRPWTIMRHSCLVGTVKRLRCRHHGFYHARTGAELRFLPPYSPDFNPIGMAFSKFKAFLKETAARTVDDPWNAIAEAIELFTPTECENDFATAGYDRECSENALE